MRKSKTHKDLLKDLQLFERDTRHNKKDKKELKKDKQKICIHIYYHNKKKAHRMCDFSPKKIRHDQFLCSLCLNSRFPEDNITKRKAKSKLCPICERSCDYCDNAIQIDGLERTDEKHVQTSVTDVSQGLNLLNEVLSVFQTKKSDNSKTVLYKDASVSADLPGSNFKSGLSLSKIFKFSIKDGDRTCDHPKFTLVNSWQPDMTRLSAINISKPKSSSIPQMKLEELRNSLKEKTKSKDAIEEVNRMFACVGKFEKITDDTNRPMVRSGPRVLPVVKTPTKVEPEARGTECRRCQVENYLLSSGDNKNTCTHCNFANKVNKCDKCVYMLSCQHNKKALPGKMICECCQKKEVCTHCGSFGDKVLP